ncbi:MAG: hypothetical protein HQL49_13335 [Gammaproteobacteria bacterium]|nr:hypothetical protein [Gammaproteobacteria bacterium]
MSRLDPLSLFPPEKNRNSGKNNIPAIINIAIKNAAISAISPKKKNKP